MANSPFSKLVNIGKATHSIRVIKTRKGAIAEAGPAGRKLQVKGSDPRKAVELLIAAGFKVDQTGSTDTVTRLTF